MKTLGAGLVILGLLFLVPLSSSAEKLPVILHGGIGFGKMIEDNAPDGSVGFGAGVIYPLSDMPIAVGGEVGFQILGKESGSVVQGGVEASADWTFSMIPITAQLFYMLPASEQATIYVDGGLGLYNWRSKYEVNTSGGGYSYSASATDTETDFGFNGGAGVRIGNPDSQISFGLDAKLHVVMTDDGEGGTESTKIIQMMGRIFFQ